MRTFERGDVIKVPFPYTDRETRQSRPALVVSTAQLQELHGLLWVVMITSAENRGWPDDVPVANLKRAGLPVPSLIRSAKIATIDASDASKLGAGVGGPGQTGHGQDQTEVGDCMNGALSTAPRAGHFPRRAANEAYRDATRQALDKTVLVDLLGVPSSMLDSLAPLRQQWCNEPTVHGGKSTRPALSSTS